MKYICIDENTLSGLNKSFGLNEVWVEIEVNGSVKREIGFDNSGIVNHKFPGNGNYGRYGIFDGSLFDSSIKSEIDEQQFCECWDRPDNSNNL